MGAEVLGNYLSKLREVLTSILVLSYVTASGGVLLCIVGAVFITDWPGALAVGIGLGGMIFSVMWKLICHERKKQLDLKCFMDQLMECALPRFLYQ